MIFFFFLILDILGFKSYESRYFHKNPCHEKYIQKKENQKEFQRHKEGKSGLKEERKVQIAPQLNSLMLQETRVWYNQDYMT